MGYKSLVHIRLGAHPGMRRSIMNMPIDKKPSTSPLPNQGHKPIHETTLKRQKEINSLIDQGKLTGKHLVEDGIEGPQTRARMAEAEKIQGKASPATRPSETGSRSPAPRKDQVQTPTKTVGEYVESQIKEAGKELKEDAQVAAITSVAAPVVGVIMARSANQAREKIAKLPMDAEGKWKTEAKQIIRQELGEAKQEILALPELTADRIKAGTDAVVDATVHTAREIGQAAHDAKAWTVDKATRAEQWVDHQLDEAGVAARKAWGNVEHHGSEAWNYAKGEVPKAFKQALESAEVGAIALNPIGAGPSAVIVARHTREAYADIAKLPMDAEGKWKSQAHAILDREAGEAKREILALPGDAWNTVQAGVREVVDQAGRAANHIADETSRKAHEIADGTVNTALKVGRVIEHEVGEARDGLGGAIQGAASWLGDLGKRIAGQ